jgi:hypothetical protein
MSPNRGGVSAASYTDDTSLPYAGCRVSIHAQVIRDHQISWFFALKNQTPHRDGEFKDYVVATFFGLTEAEREQIFKTLRTVRIHIVDPRPYTLGFHDVVRRHLPKGVSVTEFLKRLDKETAHLKGVRDLALQEVAASMLRDGHAERLKQEYRAWEYLTCGSIEVDSDTDDEDATTLPRGIDLSPFEHANANLLNDVANFLSASAAVFSPVRDELGKATEDISFRSPMAGPWLISSALSQSHAFDEGHSHAVKWIESQRIAVLSELDRRREFYPSYFLPEPLQELVSTESVPIQAADIAASISRELWARNNLLHLVRRFEYVTYNGERLSEARAAAHELSLRELR